MVKSGKLQKIDRFLQFGALFDRFLTILRTFGAFFCIFLASAVRFCKPLVVQGCRPITMQACARPAIVARWIGLTPKKCTIVN